MNAAQEQADIQRAEAKRLLNSAFGWDENITSEAVNKAVDCIIGAAILEISAIHEEAARISEESFDLLHKMQPLPHHKEEEEEAQE